MNKLTLVRLTEQEKLLYLEVEQLRAHLYLNDASILFQFFSIFYFIPHDIKNFFIKDKKEISLVYTKKKSIKSLHNIKKALLFLDITPYGWLLFGIRTFAKMVLGLKQVREDRGASSNENMKKFLIFGTTSANDLQARSVQITRNLAQKRAVVYVEGVFEEGIVPSFRFTENTPQFVAIRLTSRKLYHLNYQRPSPKDMLFLKKSLRMCLKNMHDSICYIHHPFWNLLVSHKKNQFYFDHANDFLHLRNGAEHIIAEEKKLIKKSSLVTVLHAQRIKNKKCIVLKNGVNWNQFKDCSKTIGTCDVGLCWIKKPVIGFIGTLDERIDEILLGKLANSFPSSSIVLVGNTDYRPVIEVAEKYVNIFPVGKQPYKKLPLYLQSFDILITPYKLFPNGFTDHPEMPLYLASGKPIVVTANNEVKNNPLKQSLYLPTSHIEWTDAVAEALNEKKRSKKKLIRINAN